jgi:hypothetical protein
VNTGLFCTFPGEKNNIANKPIRPLSMKIQFHHILITATLSMILMGNECMGQDASFPDYEVTDPERERLERDKILYSPGEGETRYIPRTEPKQTASKDSVSAVSPIRQTTVPVKIKPETAPKSPAKQQPPKEDDDTILSFNFLYYIIQKYKLQDIID